MNRNELQYEKPLMPIFIEKNPDPKGDETYKPIVKSWCISLDPRFGTPEKEGIESLRRLTDFFVKGLRFASLKGLYCRLLGPSTNQEDFFHQKKVETDFIVSIELLKDDYKFNTGLSEFDEFRYYRDPDEFFLEEFIPTVPIRSTEGTSPLYRVTTEGGKIYYVATIDMSPRMVEALGRSTDFYYVQKKSYVPA